MYTRLKKNDGNLVVYNEDDVEPVLDNNKRLREQTQKSDWCKHVASIPVVILNRWLHECIDRGYMARLFSREFQEEIIAKKLKDPEWKYLRTDKSSF